MKPGDYVPTLLDYARVIEWMSDHRDETMPVELRQFFTDALYRAALGRVATVMAGLDDEA